MQCHTNLGSQIAHEPQVCRRQFLATLAWGKDQFAQVLALMNQGNPCICCTPSAGAKGSRQKRCLSAKRNLLPLPVNGDVRKLEGMGHRLNNRGQQGISRQRLLQALP